MSFQRSTNNFPAPAVEGDFASANPRAVTLAGPGGFVAGPNGAVVGRFAWYDMATASVVTNSGAGVPNGFIHNDHTGLITQYLGEFTMTIPGGFPVTLFDAGDFWVKNNNAGPVTPGLKAYANNATGAVTFAAAGTPPTGGTGTASSIAAGTASVTASIAINSANLGPGTVPGVMTVTAVGSGTLVPGGTLSGTGVATGTMIVAQLTGTTGGVGTYSVNIGQTVASTTVSETYGTLTVGGTVTGAFAVGNALTGTNVTAGTYVTALGTGTGGAGTYIVSPTQTAASASISALSATETPFFCRSYGATGELVKISSRSMG